MFQLMPIALVAWIPIAVILFAKFPARRAVMVCVLGATMFLPMGVIEMPLVPFNKMVSTNVGLLIGALLMAPGPLLSFRPRLIDLPMVLLCFTPYASATANGMTFYDSFAALVSSIINWGIPYALGRAYLTDVYALRDAAQAIFVGGLIYAPLCIVEMFTSPILHAKVYGAYQHPDFMQSFRMGGWRPTIFMQHGLMVGMFMCGAALMGLWLWRQKALGPIKKVPAWLTVGFVLAVAIACKSTGAVLLLSAALASLFLVKMTRSGAVIYLLVLITPTYIAARTFGGWTGDNAVEMATEYLSAEQGGSLKTRFDNENVLVERAMTKALLGWGPKDDYLVKDDAGRITSVPDGLWVITLGTSGLIGLFALFAAFLTPTIALLRRFPAKYWVHPAMAAPGALAVFMTTYAIDCLMNAMINPVYLVAMGGLASLAVATNVLPRPAGASVAGPATGNRPNRAAVVGSRSIVSPGAAHPAGNGMQPARLR